MIKSSPRDYQKNIFETAKKANTLVVLPTGVGKTLIAIMLSIYRIEQFPEKKILMLAPTRPLVEQHLNSFKKELPELFADLQLFTGAIDSKQRQKIWQTAKIIFSTPQCIVNDLNNHLYNLKDVSLLIIDEAHRCLKNYDYTKVVKFYKEQAGENIQRILGLTASPGSDRGKVSEICKHLDIKEVELRTRNSQDVKSYLQELEFNKIEVQFPNEFIEIRMLLKKIYDKKIEQLKNRSLLFGPANKINLLKLQNRLFNEAPSRNGNILVGLSLCSQAIKLSHAIELLETQTLSGFKDYIDNLVRQAKEKKSRGVQTIVNSPEFKACMLSLNNLLKQKIEHPKIEKLKKIVEKEFIENKKTKIMIFSQFRESALTIVKNLNEIPEIKAEIFVGQAKKSNSSGATGLSQKKQREIIDKFKNGEINVLCATSIGEEGLDIPEVNSVFFYEPIPSAIRKIQRAGRTARLAPGKLFILITKDTRDQAYHYASLAKEKKMYKTIESIKDEIKNENNTINKYIK